MSKILEEKITDIGRHNPIVHAALRMAGNGQFSYEEALQIAVIELAAANEQQVKMLIDHMIRQPRSTGPT